MAFGNILGQILQQGMGGSSPTRSRLDQTTNNLSTSGGGGLDAIFGQVQNALGRAGGSGGMLDMAKQYAGRKQVGNLSNAQVGGIGAVAGALLGGGLGGAAKGGALAVLGTLAMTALNNSRQQQAQRAPEPAVGDVQTAPPAIEFDESMFDEVTSPAAEKLALRAMIAAAKVDGKIDRDELQAIMGKIGSDEVTEEEKQFVMNEINTPSTIDDLVRDVRSEAQAAEVYAATLLAIKIDTQEEVDYVQNLAEALKLDHDTVAELHKLTGVQAG